MGRIKMSLKFKSLFFSIGWKKRFLPSMQMPFLSPKPPLTLLAEGSRAESYIKCQLPGSGLKVQD
jgi:hypothetical protein